MRWHRWIPRRTGTHRIDKIRERPEFLQRELRPNRRPVLPQFALANERSSGSAQLAHQTKCRHG
jgi:hypothetical protein